MDWGDFAFYLKLALGGWLFFLMAFVVLRILTGRIILTGLLRMETHAPFGFDRLQLVFVTLFLAAGYVVAAIAQNSGKSLPNIPTPLLLILIGSNATYLAVKYSALLGSEGRGK